ELRVVLGDGLHLGDARRGLGEIRLSIARRAAGWAERQPPRAACREPMPAFHAPRGDMDHAERASFQLNFFPDDRQLAAHHSLVSAEVLVATNVDKTCCFEEFDSTIAL